MFRGPGRFLCILNPGRLNQGTLATAQALAAGKWKEIMEETDVDKTGFCELSPHLVEEDGGWNKPCRSCPFSAPALSA